MKNIKFLSALVILLGMFSACEDKSTFPIPEFESGGLVKATLPPDNSFLDFSDIENAKLIMDLVATDKAGGTLVDAYEIYATYTDVSEEVEYDEVLLATATTFPSRLEITSQQVAEAFGLPGGIDFFEPGDLLSMRMVVVMKDGREFDATNSSAAVVQEAGSRGTFLYDTFIGCPSEIPAGTWSTNVTNPAGGTYQISISSAGGGQYNITNFNLDFQPPFYDTFTGLPITGGFQDICNTIVLNGTHSYGVAWRGEGTYDPETNVITIPEIWDVGYGQGPWDNGGEGYTFTLVP